jgi:hypothetical protein
MIFGQGGSRGTAIDNTLEPFSILYNTAAGRTNFGSGGLRRLARSWEGFLPFVHRARIASGNVDIVPLSRRDLALLFHLQK